MLVILKETTRKLGNIGDVLKVKKGFARNYLLPFGKAVRATKEALVELEKQKEKLVARKEAELQEAQKLAENLASIDVLAIYAQAERNVLFGAVGGKQIVSALSDRGISLALKNIVLSSPIKELGAHEVKIFLHPDVSHTLNIHVIEASRQVNS